MKCFLLPQSPNTRRHFLIIKEAQVSSTCTQEVNYQACQTQIQQTSYLNIPTVLSCAQIEGYDIFITKSFSVCFCGSPNNNHSQGSSQTVVIHKQNALEVLYLIMVTPEMERPMNGSILEYKRCVWNNRRQK